MCLISNGDPHDLMQRMMAHLKNISAAAETNLMADPKMEALFESFERKLQAVAKRVKTLTVDDHTMRVIQVSASPTPLPPQAKLFPFPLGTQTKGYQH